MLSDINDSSNVATAGNKVIRTVHVFPMTTFEDVLMQSEEPRPRSFLSLI